MASGDVESKNQDIAIEDADQTSPSMLMEKGLELETCDDGDCPDQDPASESPWNLGFCSWIQRAFGQKMKK